MIFDGNPRIRGDRRRCGDKGVPARSVGATLGRRLERYRLVSGRTTRGVSGAGISQGILGWVPLPGSQELHNCCKAKAELPNDSACDHQANNDATTTKEAVRDFLPEFKCYK